MSKGCFFVRWLFWPVFSFLHLVAREELSIESETEEVLIILLYYFLLPFTRITALIFLIIIVSDVGTLLDALILGFFLLGLMSNYYEKKEFGHGFLT